MSRLAVSAAHSALVVGDRPDSLQTERAWCVILLGKCLIYEIMLAHLAIILPYRGLCVISILGFVKYINILNHRFLLPNYDNLYSTLPIEGFSYPQQSSLKLEEQELAKSKIKHS